MTDFRSDLLHRVGEGEFSTSYAKDRLDAAKQIIRWLWRERTLEDLPRVIDDRQFNISVSSSTIKTFSREEIRQLITEANGPLRLHILLGLNAAFTQKDISDLQHGEVQWKQGTIRRKRSKTRNAGNVPVVTYALWKETLELLKEHRSRSADRLLVNGNGGLLKSERLRPDGKLHKVDTIQRNFGRLCRRLKISGRTFTCLKKTSASLIRDKAGFTGIETYFLGHAPRSIGDRHYASGPDKLLAEASEWLREELQIEEAIEEAGRSS